MTPDEDITARRNASKAQRIPMNDDIAQSLLRRLGVEASGVSELCSTQAIRRFEVLGAILERDLHTEETVDVLIEFAASAEALSQRVAPTHRALEALSGKTVRLFITQALERAGAQSAYARALKGRARAVLYESDAATLRIAPREHDAEDKPDDSEAELSAQFEASLARTPEQRIELGLLRTPRPVLDDAPFRAFESTAHYRAWCDAELPAWLGYRTR